MATVFKNCKAQNYVVLTWQFDGVQELSRPNIESLEAMIWLFLQNEKAGQMVGRVSFHPLNCRIYPSVLENVGYDIRRN